MKTIHSFQKPRTSVLPILIILVSLFIAFVFTYDLFIEYQDKAEGLAVAISNQKKVGETLENLNRAKEEAKKNSAELEKYIQEFREDTIYDKVFSLVGSDGKIWGISIGQGETLTSGLTLSDIQFSLELDSLSNLLSFLDRATDANGKQRFLVKSVSFPYASASVAPITAAVTLGIYTIK